MPSKIEWTEETWNPVTGCDKVSPGCAHCYAETWSKRFNRSFEVALHPERLDIPTEAEEAHDVFRQQHERHVPRGHPLRTSSKRSLLTMMTTKTRPQPHLAGTSTKRTPSQRRTPWKREACGEFGLTTGHGRRTSGWGCRSRASGTPRASTSS